MQSMGSPGHLFLRKKLANVQIGKCANQQMCKSAPMCKCVNRQICKCVNVQIGTYVLSGCDEQTAGDEDNDSGLEEAKLLSEMII